MQALLTLSKTIDGMNRVAGVVATWLVLGAALVCAFDAGFRYSISTILYLAAQARSAGGFFTALFDFYRDNSNTLRDLQLVMFTGMVMLGAGWTLKLNEHVRVDLLYSVWSDRTRNWIDLIGAIFFLLPFCVLLLHFSWPWFMEAWINEEMSQNAGGLPRWPVKGFIPLGACLLFLQGISEIIKCVHSLITGERREHAYEKPVQ